MFAEFQSGFEADAACHACGECFIAEWKDHDEAVFDDAGILDGEDIVVFEWCGGANFAAKIGENRFGCVLCVGDFYCHPNALHGVHGLVDAGEPAGAQLAFDAIFAELLANFEFAGWGGSLRHRENRSGTLRAGRTMLLNEEEFRKTASAYSTHFLRSCPLWFRRTVRFWQNFAWGVH